MDKYVQATTIISGLKASFRVVEISTGEALGHVLQENIQADMPMPSFHKSAVDGYACRKEDLGNELELLENISAGMLPSKTIGENQCSKIMTGAPVPAGANCVFMIEDAELSGEKVRCTNENSKLNICYLGEDYKQGDLLLEKGTILQPGHLAAIAGAGMAKIKVAEMPKIALLVTGTELVEFNEKPEGGKIRNTNAIQLQSILAKMHFPVDYKGLVTDNYDMLNSLFQEYTEQYDVLILTGGAAVGDFDLVPEVISDNNFDIHWTRTGLKPGNPMTYASKGRSHVFGLSGNPVSSYVQFEYLVKPVLYGLLGASYSPLRIKAETADAYYRKNPSRMGVVPVKINGEGQVEELPFNGSAHIHALSFADAFMEIPAGQKEIKKGELIYVRPL